MLQAALHLGAHRPPTAMPCGARLREYRTPIFAGGSKTCLRSDSGSRLWHWAPLEELQLASMVAHVGLAASAALARVQTAQSRVAGLHKPACKAAPTCRCRRRRRCPLDRP